MAEVTPRERRIAIAATIVFVPALIALIAVGEHYSKPRGRRVATIDLLSGANEVPIDVVHGTKVRFSVDLEARLGNSEIADLMEHTQLAITLLQPGHPERMTACAAYTGTSHKSPSSSQNIQYRNGVEVKCELDPESSGPARVRAKVTWPDGPRPRRATLAVRLGDERAYP